MDKSLEEERANLLMLIEEKMGYELQTILSNLQSQPVKERVEVIISMEGSSDACSK
ncbi:MAG: hypothetical protein WHT07_06130 [Desulfobaccales bacterium]